MNLLEKTVIASDLCIGCGACAYAQPGKYSIYTDARGFLQARTEGSPSKTDEQTVKPETVCPFANESLNEDQIAEKVFESKLPKDPFIGKFIQCYAGRISDESEYQNSSSGGVGRWLLKTLLQEGHVDYVATVFDTPAQSDRDPLFAYDVTNDPQKVFQASKSAYHPVELSQVLQKIKTTPGRYAITGVPCFIKAIRNLCRQDPDLNERIRFTVGIVCGHLKSRFYAELLGWQLGVPPNDLRTLDFRKKLPGKKANEKGVTATRISNPDEPVPSKTVKEMFGTDYGLGLFKYPACDFCDDVVAETADISIGDAWLPEYMNEGTSLVIVRNRQISDLFEEKIASEELKLDKLNPRQAFQSQEAGFRHRREGLAFRLSKKNFSGQWKIHKRVAPGEHRIDRKYQRIFSLREKIIPYSLTEFQNAKKKNDLAEFQKQMDGFYANYKIAYSSGFKFIIRKTLNTFNIREQKLIAIRQWLRNKFSK